MPRCLTSLGRVRRHAGSAALPGRRAAQAVKRPRLDAASSCGGRIRTMPGRIQRRDGRQPGLRSGVDGRPRGRAPDDAGGSERPAEDGRARNVARLQGPRPDRPLRATASGVPSGSWTARIMARPPDWSTHTLLLPASAPRSSERHVIARPGRSACPAHRLGLGVQIEALDTVLATDTAALVTAVRRVRAVPGPAVDGDRTGANLACDVQAALE